MLSRLRRSPASAGYALGLVFIVLVACIWAGASVLIQYIYSDLSFESPFVLTMVCTSLFSVYLPWLALCGRLGLAENPPFRDPPSALGGGGRRGGGGAAPSLAGGANGTGSSGRGICYTPVAAAAAAMDHDGLPLRHAVDDRSPSFASSSSTSSAAAGGAVVAVRRPKAPLWSHLRTMRVSLVVFPLFFLANFSYNVSLAHTSVTSNTIISTTSSLWTFLFSTCLKLERFTWVKMLGLLLSIGGTILVGLADQNSGTDTVAGDALCLFAAIMYGVYTTALRVLVPDDDALSFQLLFGYVGAFSFATLLPAALVLWKAAPATFQGFTPTVFGFIVVNGLCDNVLSDYLWARSIVLTSPTVATVGLSLTIPLAFLSDAAMGKLKGGPGEVLGALAVAGGFLLVSFNQKGQVEEEEREEATAAAAAAAAAATTTTAAGGGFDGIGGEGGVIKAGVGVVIDEASEDGEEDRWSLEDDDGSAARRI